MKKLLLILTLVIPIVSFAQTKKRPVTKKPAATVKAPIKEKEHLTVFGYPLTGKITDFVNKLVTEKRCTVTHTYDDGNLVVLNGNFWKFENCEIRVWAKDGIVNSSQVTTEFAFIDDKKEVLEKYTEKYGLPQVNADYTCYVWNIPSGKIQINDNSYVPFMFIFSDYSIEDRVREEEAKKDADL